MLDPSDYDEWASMPSGVERLLASVKDLAADDVAGLDAAGMADRLAGIRQAISALEGEWLTELAEFHSHGCAVTLGWGSTQAWLRGELHMSRAADSKAVHTAKSLRS